MAEGTRQNAVSRHKRQTTLASGGKLRVIPGPWLGIRACRYDVRASLVPLQFIELLFHTAVEVWDGCKMRNASCSCVKREESGDEHNR